MRPRRDRPGAAETGPIPWSAPRLSRLRSDSGPVLDLPPPQRPTLRTPTTTRAEAENPDHARSPPRLRRGPALDRVGGTPGRRPKRTHARAPAKTDAPVLEPAQRHRRSRERRLQSGPLEPRLGRGTGGGAHRQRRWHKAPRWVRGGGGGWTGSTPRGGKKRGA